MAGAAADTATVAVGTDMDAADTATLVAAMRVAPVAHTVAPIVAVRLVRHAAAMPVAQPEAAQPLQLAAAALVAAEPAVAVALAVAAMVVVAADTGKRIGLRGSPQIAAELPDKARPPRRTGFVFVAMIPYRT